MPVAPPWISRLFQTAALFNWLATALTVVSPGTVVEILGLGDPPRYLFLLRTWAGMGFLFGFLFWEIARRPAEHVPLVKYGWLVKSVSALSALFAWTGGEIPGSVFALFLVTDWIWIPPFLYADYLLRTPWPTGD